eukprot:3839440-Amphidinium_carterae.1
MALKPKLLRQWIWPSSAQIKSLNPKICLRLPRCFRIGLPRPEVLGSASLSFSVLEQGHEALWVLGFTMRYTFRCRGFVEGSLVPSLQKLSSRTVGQQHDVGSLSKNVGSSAYNL